MEWGIISTAGNINWLRSEWLKNGILVFLAKRYSGLMKTDNWAKCGIIWTATLLSAMQVWSEPFFKELWIGVFTWLTNTPDLIVIEKACWHFSWQIYSYVKLLDELKVPIVKSCNAMASLFIISFKIKHYKHEEWHIWCFSQLLLWMIRNIWSINKVF